MNSNLAKVQQGSDEVLHDGAVSSGFEVESALMTAVVRLEGSGRPGSEILYSPIIDRPRIVWPGGAAVALWVGLNIEHYQYEPEVAAYINPWPRVPKPPDAMMYSYYDYASRVGFWRMLEVLDKHAIPVTASVNAAVFDHFPEIGAAIAERQWGVMCHGIYNTEYLFGLDVTAERAFFADITATILRHVGRPLKGLLGPAGSATPNTMRLMAEAGLSYCADWAIDDQPFPINVAEGRIVGMPYAFDVNDDGMMALGYGQAGYEAEDFVRVALDQLEILRMEGRESGRVMCLGLHSYVFGHPHRISYLDRLLERLKAEEGLWLTTADEIAEYYLCTYFDEQMDMLRDEHR
jgi:allantoinase